MSTQLVYPGIDAAIAAFETGGNPQSAAALANNPGALQPGPFASLYGASGAVPVAGGMQIASFPTPAQGQAAEDALVGYYAGQGDTVTQLIQNWSVGPNGTPTQTTTNYINSVAKAVGVDPGTPVSQLVGVGSVSSPAGSGACGFTNPAGCFSGFSWGRVGAFALGIVAIMGAIFLFKPAVIREAIA